MNLTPKSFPVSSPLAQALSGDVAALDGTPDYSSSSHTEHLHPQAMVNDPQQLSGLGILHGGMGIPLNRLRGCPTSESLQLPSDGWGDQTIPGQSFPDATLNGGGFPAPASYEQYDSRPPVSSAAFGISNLASHSMGASLCYSPNVGLRGSGNTFYDQYSGSWPVTPRSQTSTPSGNSARVKGEIDRAWDASIPHRPAFPDARDETPVHGMTHLSRATISDSFFTPQMSNGQSGDRLFELDPNVGPPTERERRDSTQTSSIGSPRSDITSRRTSRRQNSPVVNGLQCTALRRWVQAKATQITQIPESHFAVRVDPFMSLSTIGCRESAACTTFGIIKSIVCNAHFDAAKYGQQYMYN
ncbi:hypothetical protein M432DRAFT_643148 [Thermoascus aurantiacus ATCC 26904]